MTVRIGHASIDENGKAAGGIAGDQSGREVRISGWYNGGWQFAARAKSSATAEAIAAAAEAGCANPNIGYDQSGRNTLMSQAKAVDFDMGRIMEPCEADCSSFICVCVRAALGWDFYSGNAPTTRTLKKVLSATGAFEILTEDAYLTKTSHLRRGDILCKAASHTVIVLDDGTGIVPAAACVVRLPVLKKGSAGSSVKILQILLTGMGCSCGGSGTDGVFGTATESALKRFQKEHDLKPDGKCGPKTWPMLLAGGIP